MATRTATTVPSTPYIIPIIRGGATLDRGYDLFYLTITNNDEMRIQEALLAPVNPDDMTQDQAIQAAYRFKARNPDKVVNLDFKGELISIIGEYQQRVQQLKTISSAPRAK